MKVLGLSLLLSSILFGCSGSGGDGEATTNGGIVVSAQVVSDVNEEIQAQPQYQLSSQEIELLFDEGVINEEQKQELLALAQ